MNKQRIIATTVALGLLAPTVALAQSGSAVAPRAGDNEITLSGSGVNDNDFETGSFGLTGSWGRYATDKLLWGIRQSVTWADSGENSDLNGATRVFADHHFDFGAWRPFIGANIGWIYGDAVEETGIVSPEAGVKYYVSPSTFAYYQAEYQVFFEEADDVDQNFDDGAFAHTVGIGINFQ